jgi:hypothetical protein
MIAGKKRRRAFLKIKKSETAIIKRGKRRYKREIK